MIKIKSHLDDEGHVAISKKLIRIDRLLGNVLADAVADAAAVTVKPSLNIVSAAKWCDSRGFTVAKRIAIIQADAWKNSLEVYELKPLPKINVVKQSTVNASALLTHVRQGHRLTKVSNGHRCSGCLVFRSSTNFKYWSLNKCRPKPLNYMLVSRHRSNKRAKVDPYGLEPNPIASSQTSAYDCVDQFSGASSSHCPPSHDIVVQSNGASASTHVANISSAGCQFDVSDDEFPLSEDFDQPTDQACDHVDFPEQWDFGMFQDEDVPSAGSGTSNVDFPPEVVLSVPRGRWIKGKRSAVGTPYEGLVVTGSKTEQRKRVATVRSINALNHSSAKVAASAALATTRQNVGIANSMVDRFGHYGSDGIQYNHDVIDNVHVSHDVKNVHGHPNAFYCGICGAWSAGGSIRNLSEVCSGRVVAARAFQLRLLQVGVIPKPGAVIPAHARKRKLCSSN
jgi:hypothetical protein